jgi:hypothetical protein
VSSVRFRRGGRGAWLKRACSTAAALSTGAGFEPIVVAPAFPAATFLSIIEPNTVDDRDECGQPRCKLAALDPDGLHFAPLIFPALDDMLKAVPLEPAGLPIGIDVASVFRPLNQISPAMPYSRALAAAKSNAEMTLKSAPLEPSDFRFPINLATALRLSDARPLIVAAAQAGVWVAEAQLTRARLIWVPRLIVGADYIRHDGGGPDIHKGVMTAPSVNFFYD